MKKLLILSALIFVTNFYSQSWDYVGDAGFSISDANYLSMDIDLQSNDIFVGYQDIGDEGKLSISSLEYGTSDWVNVNNGLSNGYANYNSLSIDSNGNPYYSFIDGDGDTINFGYLSDNGNWGTQNPSNGGNIPGHSINSVVKQDYDGDVFVCSYHFSWRIVLYRAGSFGSGFSINNSFPDGNISSLSFDIKYNSGYVAFSNLDDEGKIDISKVDGGNISVLETYDNVSDGLSNSLDLKINPFTLEPYIAFQDIGNAGKLTVKKLSGDSWELVGAESISEGIANDISLAFNQSGVPYVAFKDVSFSNKLSVMSFDGDNWSYVGERGISSGAASYPSIKINSNDEVYVAFKDGSVSNKASVMKFNIGLSINSNSNLVTSINPNPSSKYINVNIDSELEAVVFDLLGKELIRENITGRLDISSLEKGTYILNLIDGLNTSTHKIIKE